jgi:hypothetical protein
MAERISVRVYFEDSKLLPISVADIGKYHVVDATYGPTACEKDLAWYSRHCPQDIIYTNYLGAMSFDYSWDKENDRCECYIRNSDGYWINIQNMTNRELRFAHNIPKMYIAGEFKISHSHPLDKFYYIL